jgi:hypothetical protein
MNDWNYPQDLLKMNDWNYPYYLLMMNDSYYSWDFLMNGEKMSMWFIEWFKLSIRFIDDEWSMIQDDKC